MPMKGAFSNHRRQVLSGSAAMICSSVLMPNVLGASASGAVKASQWYPEYDVSDADFVDYQPYTVPGCDVKFRGPGFDPFAVESGSYFSCLGAAQTYGRFVKRPFPHILAEHTGLKALNLGVGGAGPRFYLQNPALIEAVNRGKFVILQCMAARSESNGRFEADGSVEFVRDRVKGDRIDSGTAWQRIIDEDIDNAARYVAESRISWLENMQKLTDAITVPVIFFWFSRREPDYTIDWNAIRQQAERRRLGEDTSHFVEGLSSVFPQNVDGPTMRAAAAMCEAKAKCVSSRGADQPVSRLSTGKPLAPDEFKSKGSEYSPLPGGRNLHYPSPEMHEDAAKALDPVAALATVGRLRV